MNVSDEGAVLLLRNLKDAGCNTAVTEEFLAYEREGKVRAQRQLLLRQRNSLLRTVHENQERIDCLDFLLHSVEQKINASERTK